MEIKLPNDRRRYIIGETCANGRTYNIILSHITERQEQALIKGESIRMGNNTISNQEIYCYGKVDLDNDNDLNAIENIEINFNGIKGKIIPANYDFDNHMCTAINNLIGHSETYDILKIFKYGYGCIGKPERIIIYREWKAITQPLWREETV